VSAAAAGRHPNTAIIVPPRSTTRASEAAETDPTQRDRHLQSIAKAGRTGCQVASGYNKRSRVEMAMARFKLVIGNGLRGTVNLAAGRLARCG